MKIRAITVGLEPGVPVNSRCITAAGAFTNQVKSQCEDAGITVQTVRLATPPFPSYLREKTEGDIVQFAKDLERSCRENGIDYCSLGPVNPGSIGDRSFLAVLPTLIAETEAVFVSAMLGGGGRPVLKETARSLALIIQEIARVTPEGFGNLRFAGIINCPPSIPFFPASFHEGEPAFSLALEAADIVAAVCHPDRELSEICISLGEEIKSQVLPVQQIAQRLSRQEFVFRGIDLSPAPGLEPGSSIALAIERLGLGRFGEPGTVTGAAVITAALQETPLQTCGYCGLMLPVLEDVGLAERNNQGLLRLSDLLVYSAVCGTGLDTVPLPGDVSEAQLTALLLDVATLGWKLGKPLSARLLPIPGKRAGEFTTFDFAYFVNTKIMSVG